MQTKPNRECATRAFLFTCERGNLCQQKSVLFQSTVFCKWWLNPTPASLLNDTELLVQNKRQTPGEAARIEISTDFPEIGGTAISILDQPGVSEESECRTSLRGKEQIGAGTLTVS